MLQIMVLGIARAIADVVTPIQQSNVGKRSIQKIGRCVRIQLMKYSVDLLVDRGDIGGVDRVGHVKTVASDFHLSPMYCPIIPANGLLLNSAGAGFHQTIRHL